MRKLCIFLSVILIILSGCSKNELQNRPQNAPSSVPSNTYANTSTPKDSITFLKNYSEVMDYYFLKFGSEYAYKIIDTAAFYSSSQSDKVIADSKNAVDAAKLKLDELDKIEVINGLGLSDKHAVVLKAKNYYEITADSLIDAMKDNCNGSVWLQKIKNLSNALELLSLSCMDAKNQAELKLNELGAGKINNGKSNDLYNEVNQNVKSSPITEGITPITEEDILLSYDVLANQVFNELVSSQEHSQGYSYLVVGKYSYNDIEYYVIQAGTPTSMNEYYLIDNFSKQDDRNLYPKVYSAGWGGIQTENMELVYETKIPKP